MAINRVDYYGETLIDLTQDTVTPSDVRAGVTFHMSTGVKKTGSYNLKSVIIAAAPTGSTVICKKNAVTKTAAEKGGTWTFAELDVGTWTVTATLGSNTVSKTVTLTTLGQSASVKLEYSLVVYSSTTGQHLPFVVVKGGADVANPSLTFPAGSLSFSTSHAAVFTEESYDLEGYSTLTFEYEDNSSIDTQTFVCGVALKNTNPTATSYIAKIIKNPTSATKRTVVTLDISALDKTKKYYIGFTKFNNNSVVRTVKVYDWRCV